MGILRWKRSRIRVLSWDWISTRCEVGHYHSNWTSRSVFFFTLYLSFQHSHWYFHKWYPSNDCSYQMFSHMLRMRWCWILTSINTWHTLELTEKEWKKPTKQWPNWKLNYNILLTGLEFKKKTRSWYHSLVLDILELRIWAILVTWIQSFKFSLHYHPSKEGCLNRIWPFLLFGTFYSF